MGTGPEITEEDTQRQSHTDTHTQISLVTRFTADFLAHSQCHTLLASTRPWEAEMRQHLMCFPSRGPSMPPRPWHSAGHGCLAVRSTGDSYTVCRGTGEKNMEEEEVFYTRGGERLRK